MYSPQLGQNHGIYGGKAWGGGGHRLSVFHVVAKLKISAYISQKKRENTWVTEVTF